MMSGRMRQRLQPVFLEQLRALSTSTTVQQAVPATQDVANKSRGFLAQLFGGGHSRMSVPMTEVWPNVPEPNYTPPPATVPETESTTLPNGVKIASEATYGPTTTVGIFVESGSVNETPETTGCSHLLEYMAYKTTTHRTTFRLVRELENIGANVIASASREQMMYSIDLISSNAAEGVEVLSDSVLNPKFHTWEVDEAIAKLKSDLEKYKNNAQNIMTEGLHGVAYTGALARPLVCPEQAVKGLSADKLHHFVSQNFTAPRIVVSAAGIPHKELVSLAKPLFSGLPQQQKPPQPSSTYVGGDFRQFSTEDLTHTALAFEHKGGWTDVKGAISVTVLQFLLGGGGSFSAGGPGKGMHSRLYRRVLNRHAWMHSCAAFNSLYNHTGLVGVTASAESSRAANSVNVLVDELLALTKDVPAEDLERAKNAAISQVLINLESRAVTAEDIGRQVLTYGHRKPISEFLDGIKALRPSDISKLVTTLLKTPLTYATVGDVSSAPRYDDVAKRFK